MKTRRRQTNQPTKTTKAHQPTRQKTLNEQKQNKTKIKQQEKQQTKKQNINSAQASGEAIQKDKEGVKENILLMLLAGRTA